MGAIRGGEQGEAEGDPLVARTPAAEARAAGRGGRLPGNGRGGQRGRACAVRRRRRGWKRAGSGLRAAPSAARARPRGVRREGPGRRPSTRVREARTKPPASPAPPWQIPVSRCFHLFLICLIKRLLMALTIVLV